MSKNLTVEDLTDQAKRVSDVDFSRLIKDASTLLRKEQHALECSRVYGGLLLLKQSRKATIIGDLHGDLESLSHILRESNFLNTGEDDYLIFLGDYGDRGPYSPEVFYMVLRLKELFPSKVILMMGNHEGPSDMLPFPHDLPCQLKEKYGESGAVLYEELRKLFSLLYTTVLVERRYVLIHGGVPSNASSFGDLAYAYQNHETRLKKVRETFSWKDLSNRVNNETESILEEMLWSDPKEMVGVEPSPRGIGKLFGEDVTERFLKMLGVDVLIRGHEVCEEGFRINHNGKVLTLFSTNKPPYSNRYGAYLQIDLATEAEDGRQLKQYVKQF